jgi:hypothetical protein
MFVAFVLREWRGKNKLLTMKSVEPPKEFFDEMKAKVIAFGEKRKREANAKGESRPATGAVGAPVILDDDKP